MHRRVSQTTQRLRNIFFKKVFQISNLIFFFFQNLTHFCLLVFVLIIKSPNFFEHGWVKLFFTGFRRLVVLHLQLNIVNGQMQQKNNTYVLQIQRNSNCTIYISGKSPSKFVPRGVADRATHSAVLRCTDGFINC